MNPASHNCSSDKSLPSTRQRKHSSTRSIGNQSNKNPAHGSSAAVSVIFCASLQSSSRPLLSPSPHSHPPKSCPCICIFICLCHYVCASVMRRGRKPLISRCHHPINQANTAYLVYKAMYPFHNHIQTKNTSPVDQRPLPLST